MKQKRIAYCTPSLYIAGGIERVLTTKANYLAEVCGYEIYIILTDGKGKPPYYPLSPKVKIINLDIRFEELWTLSFLQKIPVYLKKQRIFKKELTRTLTELKPDITVSLLRREINFITHINDGSKKVGEIHVNRKNYRNFNTDGNLLKRAFAYFWDKQLVAKLKRLDAFVVLTPDDKEHWSELSGVHVIPNPLSHFPQEHSTCLNRKAIAVGRYTHQKGFDLLIEAWKMVAERHPDWELNIYGNGERAPYEQQVRQLALEKQVHCLPATPEIYEKYTESSLFILSSRFEGFGMVLAEAMSCGIPAVSFNCPYGPESIIHDEEDGLLSENGNVEALAEKICRLIEHDEERIRMGTRAKENVKRFKEEIVMQQWKLLFDQLTTPVNNQNPL